MLDLGEVMGRIEQLEADNDALREELAELRTPAPTVPIPPSSEPALTVHVGRRMLLGAGAGALIATIANALGRPASVMAHDPDDVRFGADNSGATHRTHISATGPSNADAIVGIAHGPGAKGMTGQSTKNTGVLGYNGTHDTTYMGGQYGVMGVSDDADGAGVDGYADSGVGVSGGSTSGPGVRGGSHDSNGVEGYTLGLAAVYGYSGPFPEPVAPALTGVYGATLGGRGGVFSGGPAQIQLLPSTATTHPASGNAGDIFLDKSKRLWLCKGGSTWARLD